MLTSSQLFLKSLGALKKFGKRSLQGYPRVGRFPSCKEGIEATDAAHNVVYKSLALSSLSNTNLVVNRSGCNMEAGRMTRYYSTHSQSVEKKVSILDIKKKFQNSVPIHMVTSYDYCSAKELDNADVDMILVGDSLGMVMLGEKGTSAVTIDQIIHHSKAVMKGSKKCFVVGDMPFGSFEVSPQEAVKNAFRIMKEGGVDAVKLEGGKKHADKIKAIVEAGIPVVGHIGLTPQSISALGGFKLQGKTSEEAASLLEDALALQEAGCFAIVFEMVPSVVAASITKLLKIPTIGIGAGNGTSGQVLVYHDMLGLYSDFLPKFVKKYANISEIINKALVEYKTEVEARQFPGNTHSFSMKDSELKSYIEHLSTKSNIDFGYLKDVNTEILNSSPKASEKKASNNLAPKSLEKNPQIKESEKNVLPEIKSKKPKVVVIGGGSMGSFFSAKMASKGVADVWMVSGWKEHVDNINNIGLQLYDLEGNCETVKSIKATTDGMDVIKNGYPDLALVLVKSHSTREASKTAATMVGGNPDAVVLTLQNGIGNRVEIENTIHGKGYKNRVWQGVTGHGAYVEKPGIVRHTGMGKTYIASPLLKMDGIEPKSQEEYQALMAFNSIFNESGIQSEMNYDADSLMWSKALMNAAINPLTAVLGVTNGYLVENEYSKNMMRKIINEGVDVAKAKGIQLQFGYDAEEAFKSAAEIARKTKSNYSSMLKDIVRGQQTEIKSINGVIVKEGEQLDIPVDYNKWIMEMVLIKNGPTAKGLASNRI